MESTRLHRNCRGFKQLIISRAPGLLPMFYFPEELAEDIGVTNQTVKYWLRDGITFQIVNGKTMIVGTDARNWILKSYKKTRQLAKSDPSKGYCFSCKKSVQIQNPEVKVSGTTILKKGFCPICKSKINRGVNKENMFE